MVRSERDFVVYDAKSGEDLTHSVLTQIIVEQESRGTNLLPIGFLRQLIRFYGDSMQKLVPSYLEFSLDSLTRQQEQYRRRFAHAFGTARSEEHTSELQSLRHLVCRLLLEKKKKSKSNTMQHEKHVKQTPL